MKTTSIKPSLEGNGGMTIDQGDGLGNDVTCGEQLVFGTRDWPVPASACALGSSTNASC